jgi:hypothetical protein
VRGASRLSSSEWGRNRYCRPNTPFGMHKCSGNCSDRWPKRAGRAAAAAADRPQVQRRKHLPRSGQRHALHAGVEHSDDRSDIGAMGPMSRSYARLGCRGRCATGGIGRLDNRQQFGHGHSRALDGSTGSGARPRRPGILHPVVAAGVRSGGTPAAAKARVFSLGPPPRHFGRARFRYVCSGLLPRRPRRLPGLRKPARRRPSAATAAGPDRMKGQKRRAICEQYIERNAPVSV